jgi:FtsP/CotA-like multicopper oxidase with cupredoxin domain
MSMEKTNALGRRALFKRLLGSTAIAAAASALFPAERALAQVAATPLLRRRPLANIATPPAPSAPLANPPAIVAASDGSCALDIVERTVALGTQQVRVRAFVDPNNLSTIAAPLVGPTITLAGNTTPQTEGNVQNVTVRLTNKLPIEVVPHQHASASAGEQPHGFNTTNLHTHGLHVAPDQDNVYVELSPSLVQVGACLPPVGQDPTLRCNYRYDYKYNFGQTPTGKTKLPAGTYWYHPHKHGSVGLQVASGMSGALIVKGDLDAIPGVAGLTEQVMVLQYVEYTVPPGSNVGTVDPTNFYAFTTPTNQQLSINGQINPTVAMQYGEIQRWRVVNATSEQFFYLNLAPAVGTAAAPPQIFAIATDGVALTNSSTMTVPYLLATPSYTASTLADVLMNEVAVLAPGQRLDLLVRMPAATGTAPPPQSYLLQAVQFPPNAGGVASQAIASVQVSGSKSPADTMPAAAAFNPGALFRPPIALPATLPQPTQTILFEFSPNSSVNGVQFKAPPPAQIGLKLDNLDLWSVTGSGHAQHAFHIHINSFLMTQRNGVSILPAAIWRDTVRIDPLDGVPNEGIQPITQPVQFVSQQVDYTGDFVMHCHVLQHEDTGMMLSVAITA